MGKMLIKSVCVTLLTGFLLLGGGEVNAQKDLAYTAEFNFGCNLRLTYGKKQQFPGLKLFCALALSGRGEHGFTVNYSPSLSVYTKSIGSDLNPLVGDIQMDFTNSFSAGYSWAGESPYIKHFRTIHTGDYYNVATNSQNICLLTANFILNNHRRNQCVGAITASFGHFTFNYYNDGAVPFDFIPFADNFDRYWTGGGGIMIHDGLGYNIAEVSFDQFTGYSPLLYQMSNILGIDIPIYDQNTQSAEDKPLTFNTSAYEAKINFNRNYAVHAGVVGNLVSAKGRYWGIQELIHMTLHYALHPNNDYNRYYIGLTYNNLQPCQSIK